MKRRKLKVYNESAQAMDAKTALDQLQQFFAEGKRQTFARKEVIIQGDASSSSTYWVKNGYVKVVSYTNSGNERNHFFYGPGELFPITSLYKNPIAQFTFVAVSDMECYSRDTTKLKEYLKRRPEMLTFSSRVLVNLIERLYCLQLEKAEDRVAHTLLHLGERFGTREGGKLMIDLPLNQQELADVVRLTRESVGQILNKFEQQKDIIYGRKYIAMSPDKLLARLED